MTNVGSAMTVRMKRSEKVFQGTCFLIFGPGGARRDLFSSFLLLTIIDKPERGIRTPFIVQEEVILNKASLCSMSLSENQAPTTHILQPPYL